MLCSKAGEGLHGGQRISLLQCRHCLLLDWVMCRPKDGVDRAYIQPQLLATLTLHTPRAGALPYTGYGPYMNPNATHRVQLMHMACIHIS